MTTKTAISSLLFYFILAYLEVSANVKKSCKLCSQGAKCCFEFGFCKEIQLVSSLTFLCYSLLLTEAAFICAVLMTSIAYLVIGKSFRLLCSFCGHSFGLFRGVTSPLFKFQKLKA